MRSRRRVVALQIVGGCGRIAFALLADGDASGADDAIAPAYENFSAWSTRRSGAVLRLESPRAQSQAIRRDANRKIVRLICAHHV